MHPRLIKILTICFLLPEAILYYFILTAGGTTLVVTSYLAIILCFLFALLFGIKHKPLLVGGLAFTVCADYCLVICDPIQQLWGMVFFLGAQTLYAILLYQNQKNKTLLLLRILLIIAIEAITIAILGSNLDALAVISVCYYANLFMNIVAAFAQWKKNKLLPIAFVLFILCDTVIGLQVASGGYLPISENSVLHNILFMDFNLAWFFYLPSQVLIALGCLPKGEQNGTTKETTL